LRRHWIDVSKTRNSLDPGSSRVAVVVHAINQPIDSLLYPRIHGGETFALVVAIPAEKWRRPDAWGIRKDVERDESRRPGSDKKLRRTRRARRPDLLLSYRIYLRRLCFPRKNRLRLDQARASRKKIARRLFASAKIASRGFSSYLDDSSKESARLINGSTGASIRAYLSREIQFIIHIV